MVISGPGVASVHVSDARVEGDRKSARYTRMTLHQRACEGGGERAARRSALEIAFAWSCPLGPRRANSWAPNLGRFDQPGIG